MSRVVIGMDLHKRSATIEAIDEREQVLARGRHGTDVDGYQRMLAAGREFPDRRPGRCRSSSGTTNSVAR